VAINMDPDVLLVDEILAVGDASFQEKCFQRVHQFRNSGRSLLCVSHAAGMVQQLCDKAIWLDHGEMVMGGNIAEVLEAYNGHGALAV
jgi:lipopolysaccharide transport system ATP-binding protein